MIHDTVMKTYAPLSALCLIAIFGEPHSLQAEEAQVLRATALRADMGWQFEVTIAHPDTGWDHFADQWQVLDTSGTVLATRELLHPHIEEQPFTRTLKNVVVPDGTRIVLIRGRCSLHGSYGKPVEVTLSR